MSNFEITITLPEVVVFTRAGHEMSVALSELPETIVADLVSHGVVQTVGDAASAASGVTYDGGKRNDQAPWSKLSTAQKNDFTTNNAGEIAQTGLALMSKRWDALKSGEWRSQRASAPGLTALDERCAELIAGKMTFEKGTRKPEKIKAAWEVFGGLDKTKQDAVRGMAQGQLDREAAERTALASLDIDLTDF